MRISFSSTITTHINPQSVCFYPKNLAGFFTFPQSLALYLQAALPFLTNVAVFPPYLVILFKALEPISFVSAQP